MIYFTIQTDKNKLENYFFKGCSGKESRRFSVEMFFF